MPHWYNKNYKFYVKLAITGYSQLELLRRLGFTIFNTMYTGRLWVANSAHMMRFQLLNQWAMVCKCNEWISTQIQLFHSLMKFSYWCEYTLAKKHESHDAKYTKIKWLPWANNTNIQQWNTQKITWISWWNNRKITWIDMSNMSWISQK